MCAIHILHLYLKIKNEGLRIQPRTFIFGAKASAGYVMAKEIIRFICAIADLVNNDTAIDGQLKVVFLADYRVSLAEIMMPAAEVSEQISLAGKEASGTGNMKFMINGALTIGTLDGANVEIHEQVGDDNMFLFGMHTDEVNAFRPSYRPRNVYNSNYDIREVIDFVSAGGLNGKNFDSIVRYLLDSDPYMTLADFDSYKQAQAKVNATYLDRDKWNKMSLTNIAKAGIFSSDRSVEEYAKNIWNLTKI
jgi:starch phosphorylase